MFYCFKIYIFWRAGREQIGDKKMNKMYVFFLGWEGRAGCGKIGEKKMNNISTYIYIYVVHFFGRLVAGKSAAKKLKTNICIYNHIYIHFLEGWSWKLGDIIKLFWFVLRRSPQKKARKKTCQQYCFHFSNIRMLLGFGRRKQVLKTPLKICPILSICFLCAGPGNIQKENGFESFKM